MILLKDEFTGGSFHNVYITSSINELTDVLGEPQMDDNNGHDKVNVEWNCITKDEGIKFYIYDWKYYRPLSMDEMVEFHIGGKNFMETHTACELLLDMIAKHRNAEKTPEIQALNELRDIYNNED
jgi:hypothetical protein